MSSNKPFTCYGWPYSQICLDCQNSAILATERTSMQDLVDPAICCAKGEEMDGITCNGFEEIERCEICEMPLVGYDHEECNRRINENEDFFEKADEGYKREIEDKI